MTKAALRSILPHSALLLVAIVARPPTAAAQSEVLRLLAVADSYVQATNPTARFEGQADVRADLEPERIIYLRFAVSGVNGRSVASARLRLTVVGASDNGGSVHPVADNAWDAATLTYRNRPDVGSMLDARGRVALGTVVEFDLDGAVVGDGVYSFAIVNTSSDGVSYASSEAGGGAGPELVLSIPTGPIPTVRVLRPSDGVSVFAGRPVGFEGEAFDDVDGDLSASLVWTSDVQGRLGTGSLVSATLGEGLHTITASATDGDGLGGAATITVRVEPPPIVNTKPVVRITTPASAAIVTAGAPSAFTATASDAQDGPLTAAIVWVSNVDGPLGTGGTVTAMLSPGTHRITVSVTDAGGLIGKAAVTVMADDPTMVKVAPSADTYVDAAKPAASFGASRELRIDANIERITYLRFAVAGVGSVGRALLRLRVDPTADGAQGDSGGIVRRVSDTTWDEGAVTYNSRPPVDGPEVARTGKVARGQLVDFDITAAVPGDGVYSFAIVSPSTDGVAYRARESAEAPLLILSAVGHPPQVTIATPADGAIAFADQPLDCAGTAVDVESGDLGDGLVWTSSLDGPLGTGRALSVDLSIGLHTIVAAVTDADGRAGEARVGVLVRAPNLPPAVTIAAPNDPTIVLPGTSLAFRAVAVDEFDGDLSEEIVWTSDLQGQIGTGASIVRNLVDGTHTVTAAVADADGMRGAAQVDVVVQPAPPGTPMVTILTPRDGQLLPAAQPVVLWGLADDVEDGMLTDLIEWTSDLDGALGTGGTLTPALSNGTHHITAAVTDGDGLHAAAAVTVTVGVDDLGEMAFVASADTYVDAKSPTSRQGDATKLAADTSPERIIYLRFKVEGVAPFAIRGARLRLTVRPDSSDGGDHGGTVHAISDGTWSERTTNYVNRPAVDGPALASAGPVASNEMVELDVSAAIEGEGTYNFAVVPASTNAIAYRSSESTIGQPELVVTLGSPHIVLTGTFTAPYESGPLPPDTVIDARGAIFLGFPTGSHPINLRGAPGVHLIGGTVLGQYDRTWTWERAHDFNNAGVAVENVDPIIEGVRIDNMTDGIRPRADSGSFTVRGSRLSYIRDDCIENDHVLGGLVDDSFFDGCYVAFSTRPSDEKMEHGLHGQGRVLRIQRSLIRLEPMPTASAGSPDGLGHGGFFKWHLWNDPAASRSPQLALHDNVFMAERVGEVGADRMGVPPGQLATCANNVMVWLGPGAYPAPLPDCFTVTTDRSVWDDAVADWEARHPDVAP